MESYDEIIENITTTDTSDIRRILAEFGVCVLERVISKDEADENFDRMIRDFEKRTKNLDTPFVYKKKKTWNTLNEIASQRGMMFSHWEIAHAKYVWNIRKNDNIIGAFSEIYGTDELIVSFDGVSLQLPNGETDDNKWFHVDYSLTDFTKTCFQGMLMLKKVRRKDATLCVLLKSHKYLKKYARKVIEEFCNTNNATESSIQNKFGKNWNRVDADFFKDYGCKEVRISCKSGSLILFDSKTVHYGALPKASRKKKNVKACVYLCYSPIEKIKNYSFSREVFERRSLEYYEEGRSTSHWPEYRKVNSLNPVVGRKVVYVSDIYLPTIKSPDEKMIKLITGNY